MGQHIEGGGGGRGFAGGRGATVPFTDLTLTLINQKRMCCCSLCQLEVGGKTRGEAQQDAEWALNQEREEHLRLLAESHSTSLDLRWKLQHGEKRWGRERADLLERFDRERQEWDTNTKELHHKMEKVRRSQTDVQ